VIWSILGVVAAFLVIAILSLPLLWLFGSLDSTGPGPELAVATATPTPAVALTATTQHQATATAEALAQAAVVSTATAMAQAATAAAEEAQLQANQTAQAQAEATEAAAGQNQEAQGNGLGDPATGESGSQVEAVTSDAVDIYEGPGRNYPVLLTVPAGSRLPVVGRNEAGSWWQVETPDDRLGWLPAAQVTVSDPTNLPVIEGLPQAVAAAGIDLYEQPGRTYPIVATVPAGTTLAVVGRNEPVTWWQVETADGTVGWVPAAQLETGNPAAIPVVPDLPQALATTEIDVFEGPSRNYPLLVSLPANTVLPLVGRNAASTWWQVEIPDGRLGWLPDLQVEATATSAVPLISGAPLAVAGQDVDVHEGPGRNYPLIGLLPPRIPLPVVGQNEAGSWWQIQGPDRSTGWVPDLLVDTSDTENVPIVEAPPPPETEVDLSAPSTRGEDYIVQRDDWLSKLSEKFYSEVTAYWPIMAVTNQVNALDPTYARIDDEDVIEIGDKLRIPSVEDALAFMADFDPEEDVAKLFPAGEAGQLVVGSWWTAPGEFVALNSLYQPYLVENPAVELVDAGVNGGEISFREANLARLADGNPYDVFLANLGFEVTRYSPAENLVPVSDILTATGTLEALPEAVQSLLQLPGETYLVPLNIHRGDVMWTNLKLLEQAGLAPPTTFDEFFAACDTLRGQGIVPLALGSAGGFELSHTFEVVLAGTVGPETTNALWNGFVGWDDPGVGQALTNFSRMLDCSNDDRAGLSWLGAIDRVIDDQAAFNIMGDWAYAEVILKDDLAYVLGARPPGSQGQFLLVANGFALAQAAPNPANARAFLTLLTQPAVQAAFSQNKGALCARTDCDYSAFPADRQAYFQSAAADLANGLVVPMMTHGAATGPAWQDQVNRIINQFAVDRDVVAAQAALIGAAAEAGVSP
jgi:glucose/mannose transport system substrate-binding protein